MQGLTRTWHSGAHHSRGWGDYMTLTVRDERLLRALELLGNHLDPEIEEAFPTMEERILAQALENVEEAERRLREIQALVGDVALASSH